MSVDTRPGESFEGLMKRFRKEVAKSRILSTYRRKRWFTPPSEERRLAQKKAERRARRRALRATKPKRGAGAPGSFGGGGFGDGGFGDGGFGESTGRSETSRSNRGGRGGGRDRD